MNYLKQLQDVRWLQKRDGILLRDSFSCRRCNNKSYIPNTSAGLVISNSLNFVGRTHFALDKWHFLVWDLKNNIVFRGRTADCQYSPDKSYICYYRRERINGLLKDLTLGLKEISNDDIHIKETDLIERITENNYRALVEEETFNFIYNSSYEPTAWTIIFGLQVHHTFYQNDKLAWEYPDDALITLCPTCHKEIHEITTIPVIEDTRMELSRIRNLDLLEGSGRIRRRRTRP